MTRIDVSSLVWNAIWPLRYSPPDPTRVTRHSDSGFVIGVQGGVSGRLAQRYGTDPGLVASSIVIGTTLSIVVIPTLLYAVT